MNITLRALNPKTDFPALADLVNAVGGQTPVTVEDLQKAEVNRPEGTIVHRTGAFDEAGRLLGSSVTTRNPWSNPGEFYARVRVLPEARNQGIGRALADESKQFLTAQKAVAVVSEVRDDSPESLRFAQSFGFAHHTHVFQSRLDLTTFDETPFVGALEKAGASGIRFFTIADIGGPTEENMRVLYELEFTVGRDIPGNEDQPDVPFAEYFKFLTKADWFRAEGQIVAADGDQWVGMAAVSHYPNDNEGGHMYHNMTGVRREYRGRGIAQALKLLAVRCARKLGVRYMKTGNASNNAPMLAINRKMGYQSLPGTYYLKKSLE